MATKRTQQSMASTDAKRTKLDQIDELVDIDPDLDKSMCEPEEDVPLHKTMTFNTLTVRTSSFISNFITITLENFTKSYNELKTTDKIPLVTPEDGRERKFITKLLKTIYQRRFLDLPQNYDTTLICKMLFAVCNTYEHKTYQNLGTLTQSRKTLTMKFDADETFVMNNIEEENIINNEAMDIYFKNNIAPIINIIIVFFSSFDLPTTATFMNKISTTKVSGKDKVSMDSVGITFNSPVLVQLEEEEYGVDKQKHYVVIKETSSELYNLIKKQFDGDYSFNMLANINVCKYKKSTLYDNAFYLDKGITKPFIPRENIMLAFIKSIDIYIIKNCCYAKVYTEYLTVNDKQILFLTIS